jgi:hypothetical protein
VISEASCARLDLFVTCQWTTRCVSRLRYLGTETVDNGAVFLLGRRQLAAAIC